MSNLGQLLHLLEDFLQLRFWIIGGFGFQILAKCFLVNQLFDGWVILILGQRRFGLKHCGRVVLLSRSKSPANCCFWIRSVFTIFCKGEDHSIVCPLVGAFTVRLRGSFPIICSWSASLLARCGPRCLRSCISWCMSFICSQLFLCSLERGKPISHLWKSTVLATFWTIWLEHNSMIFKDI